MLDADEAAKRFSKRALAEGKPQQEDRRIERRDGQCEHDGSDPQRAAETRCKDASSRGMAIGVRPKSVEGEGGHAASARTGRVGPLPARVATSMSSMSSRSPGVSATVAASIQPSICVG
ncbi:hypothetical protein D9M70_553930 [compost metagenome]